MARPLPLNPYAAEPLAVWEARLHGDGRGEERFRAFEAVTHLAPRAEAARHALRLLNDADAELRAAACRWLAGSIRRGELALPFQELSEGLSRCLADADPDVQFEAVRGLAWLAPESPGLAEVVLRLLDQAEGRTTTLALLVELSGGLPQLADRLLERLRQWLADDAAELREAVAMTLARWGVHAASAETELAAALDDEDPLVREHAAVALQQLPRLAPATQAALESAAKDDDPGVAQAAQTALQRHRS